MRAYHGGKIGAKFGTKASGGKLHACLIFCCLIVVTVLLFSCDRSGGNGDPSDANRGSDIDEELRITVEKVEDVIAEAGGTASNTRLVHQDGIDDDGVALMDIDRVIISRVSDSSFSNDLSFAYDGIYSGTDLIDSLNSSLYVDTDLNANTGQPVSSIGADLRLTNQGLTLITGVFEWDDRLNTWVAPEPEGGGSAVLSEITGEVVNVIIVVADTSQYITSLDTRAVLIVERIAVDGNTILERLGSTSDFIIPGVQDGSF